MKIKQLLEHISAESVLHSLSRVGSSFPFPKAVPAVFTEPLIPE
jgi:hypothetical protein